MHVYLSESDLLTAIENFLETKNLEATGKIHIEVNGSSVSLGSVQISMDCDSIKEVELLQ